MKNLYILMNLSSRSCPQVRAISSKKLGSYFEWLTVNALKKYCFDISLCGGPKDRGIDFRGVWRLNSRNVSTIGQCKCYKRRLGPVHVRELEGTMSHERKETLGLLVTSIGFTKDAYQHFMSSAYPIALTVLDSPYLHNMDMLNNSSARHAKEEAQERTLDTPCLSENSNNLNLDKKVCGPEEPCGNFCQQNVNIENESCIRINQDENYKKQLNVVCHNSCKVVKHTTACVSFDKVIKKSKKLQEDDIIDDILSQNSYMDHINDDVSVHGELSLFELNMTARRLVPDVVIGRTFKMRNSGSPRLLLHEDKLVTELRS